MTGHENYFSYLTPSENGQKIMLGLILGISMLLIGKMLTSRLKTAQGLEAAIIPSEKVTLFGFVELLIDGFIGFYDSVLGKENRQHAPLVATIFFFILIANLIGLIPGMPAITTTVWINVAMAIVVFVYFNWQGIKAQGLIGYLKHFCGPNLGAPWYFLPLAFGLGALMFAIEIFSTCLRILTLNLRLYWNITADHQVVSVFTEMLRPYPGIPVVFYILGTFVCFMQAFVFTTLTMVYILLATQHEEEEHH